MKKIIFIFILLLFPILSEARMIDTIIIHHSESNDVSVETITKWHKKRGFRTIGYHYVIRADGTVEKGRSIEEAGAHAKGRNAHSIGICVTGYDKFTEAQRVSLKHLCEELCSKRELKIERHHDKCPGQGLDVESLALRVKCGSTMDATGYATYYKDWTTSSGHNMYLHPFAKTCASWFYPIGTKLLVHCFDTNKDVVVVVKDRGPNKKLVAQGRIIDLSVSAFKQISQLNVGIVHVGIERIN